MNTHRRTALVLATCMVGLSLAACSTGLTSASSPGTSSRAAAHSATPTHMATPSPTPISSSTVSVTGVGSFPIPPEAKVASNTTCGKFTIIELGSVTPKQASTFYASALPTAGYTITLNTLTSAPTTGTMAELMFTGHGYAGVIITSANLGSEASGAPASTGLPSNLGKNVTEIALGPGSSLTSPPSC